jgi:hypothetical protein
LGRDEERKGAEKKSMEKERKKRRGRDRKNTEKEIRERTGTQGKQVGIRTTAGRYKARGPR